MMRKSCIFKDLSVVYKYRIVGEKKTVLSSVRLLQELQSFVPVANWRNLHLLIVLPKPFLSSSKTPSLSSPSPSRRSQLISVWNSFALASPSAAKAANGCKLRSVKKRQIVDRGAIQQNQTSSKET
ncbi:hypothetical protein MRB53_010580 [Persea americana]|uniref:Uncharacterized protein n=1 Tax=Persea americana TaxID=3435 RepID=A0ACC2LT03_PERAE|nr:hypothetical protein MRB53_010580 [Persea americana]